MVDFYQLQARNRRATWLLMASLLLLLGLLGFWLDRFYLGTFDPDRGGFPIATLLAVSLASIQSLHAFYAGDKSILRSVGARPVDPEHNLDHRELNNVVAEMCIASGLPMPRLYVMADSDANAFATGRDAQHASVCVTQGLLDGLNRDELQGVIAHELSHVKNYDIRTMMVVSVLLGSIVLLSDWARRSLWHGGGRRSRSDRGNDKGAGTAVLAILVLFLMILAPLISQLMAMAVSRRREYLADATGAELTRNPLALAHALEKIAGHRAPTARATRGTAHLFIHDPLERAVDSREGFVADLFSTHPPIQKRIELLKQMAHVG